MIKKAVAAPTAASIVAVVAVMAEEEEEEAIRRVNQMSIGIVSFLFFVCSRFDLRGSGKEWEELGGLEIMPALSSTISSLECVSNAFCQSLVAFSALISFFLIS